MLRPKVWLVLDSNLPSRSTRNFRLHRCFFGSVQLCDDAVDQGQHISSRQIVFRHICCHQYGGRMNIENPRELLKLLYRRPFQAAL